MVRGNRFFQTWSGSTVSFKHGQMEPFPSEMGRRNHFLRRWSGGTVSFEDGQEEPFSSHMMILKCCLEYDPSKSFMLHLAYGVMSTAILLHGAACAGKDGSEKRMND